MTGKRKFLTLATTLVSAVCLGVGVIVVSGITTNNMFAKADDDYSTILNSTNGAINVSSLKTNERVAKTNLDNNVTVYFKNAEVASGKLGKVKAKGFYGNKTPIYDMTSVRVVSNAAPGDAVLKYGPTSSYMPNSVDLATASTAQNVGGANYFKIEANKDVIVESVSIVYGCMTHDFGPIAYNGSNEIFSNAFKTSFSDGKYSFSQDSSNVKRAMFPDYYDDGEHGEAPVTIISTGSSGVFEYNTLLEEIYMPETITGFGSYIFGGSSYLKKVKEFTLPYALRTAGYHPLPKGDLEVLNIHSVNFDGYTAGQYNGAINADNFSKLTTINVSYDVEYLPNIIYSWPASMKTINYEGTEAEWLALTSVAGTSLKWTTEFTGDVICSDTTFGEVTLVYTGATLNDIPDTQSVNVVVGKAFNNPGTPVNTDTTKKFNGWYSEANGAGTQFTFPYTVTGDITLYADFINMPVGYDANDPIIASLDTPYSFFTDSQKSFGYVKYTATADSVVVATVSNWTSAASCSYKVYVDGVEKTVSTGSSATTDVKNYSTWSSFGSNVPLKVRASANEEVVFRFGSDGNEASFDVTLSAPGSGEDYTTAPQIDEFDVENSTVVNSKGTKWIKFDVPVSGSYQFRIRTDKYASVNVGTINGETFSSIKSFNAAAATSGGSTYAIISLTAGTMYYVCFTSNTDNSTAFFTGYSTISDSFTKDTAQSLTFGTPVTVQYTSGIAPKWYTFTVSSAGLYTFTSNKTLNAGSGNTDWTSTLSSTPTIGLFENDGTTSVSLKTNSSNSKQLYVENLDTGTYYIKARTSYVSSDDAYNYDLCVAKCPVVTLSFETNGADAIADMDVNAGFAISNPPADPTKANHRFDGWFSDEGFNTPFSFSTGITENTTIYAKWVRQYTVTIHPNNGGETYTAKADSGAIYSPEMPVYENHGLVGWFYDSEFTQDYDYAPVTSDFDLYASWRVMHFDSTAADYIENEVANSMTYLYSHEAVTKGMLTPSGKKSFAKYSGHASYGSGIKSTNEGENSSSSQIQFKFKTDAIISFKYAISSEGSSTIWDYFAVSLNGTQKLKTGGETLIENAEFSIRANKDDVLLLEYTKDGSNNKGLDAVYIYDIAFEAAPVIVRSLELNTDNAKKVFALNEPFSYAGLVATAHYSDETSAVVTPTSVSTPDMTTDAMVTITVSYTENNITVSATYMIKVGNPPHYTNAAANFIENIAGAQTYLNDYTSNDPGITWGTYSFTTDTKYGGIKAVGSSSSSAEITLKFKAACVLSFKYLISSEANWDKGYILHNNVAESSINGISGVGTELTSDYSITVAADDTITFRYSKDGSGDKNDDTFYIYNISFAAIA